MTMASIAGLPRPLIDFGFVGGVPSISSATFLLDAASEAAAIIFQAPKSGEIDMIGGYIGAHTTGATLEFALQGMTGVDPDGTNVDSSGTGTAASSGTGWIEAALSPAATVVRGTIYAAIIRQPAAGSGSCALGAFGNFGGASGPTFPYGSLYTGTWAKSVSRPIIAARYDDGEWASVLNTWPITAISTTTVSSSSTPDEIALRFQSAVPLRICGAHLFFATGNVARDFDIVLYDAGGSALATKSIDADQSASTGSSHHRVLFDANVDISANTTYYLAVKPTTTGVGTVNYVDVAANAKLSAIAGIQCYWAERTDAGAWTTTDTRLPYITPLILGADDGAGGGGLLIHPGMTGGLIT